MVKVLTAAVLGTVIGVVVMVAVIAIYGTDTEGASSEGLGSLPISTFSTSTPTSAPTSSTPSSQPSTGGSTSGSTGASGDAAHGEQLFKENCASCHVTEPGAAPTVGPNLADLAPSLDEQRILNQIANGGAVMPAGLLSGQDAKDAAAYVLSLAKK